MSYQAPDYLATICHHNSWSHRVSTTLRTPWDTTSAGWISPSRRHRTTN